jgi:hypothetical protein
MASNNHPEVMAELMYLAFASCSTAPNLEYHPVTPSTPISADSVGVYIPQPDESRALASVQPVEVSRVLSALRTVRTGPDTSVFRMSRLTGTDTVRVALSAFEDLEGYLGPLDSLEISYGVSRTGSFSSAGLRLENSGSEPASLRLERTGRPDTTFQIPGGGALRVLAALQLSGRTNYRLVNQGSTARIIWEDLGHSWSVRLGTAQSDTAQIAVTRILRGPLRGSHTSLGARVRGVPGDSVEYGIYPPPALPLLGVDALGTTPAPALRIVGVLPNPATGPSRVRFEQGGNGPLEVALFDAAGRRWGSWTVDEPTSTRHEVRWSGSDSQGTSAPPGVYFWRVRSLQSGASSTVRFVRLR